MDSAGRNGNVLKVSPAEKARRQRFFHFMTVYWCSRQAWVEAREYATGMYAEEVERWEQDNPPVLFKNFLVASRGQPR